jgi:hypothetical protein
MSRKVYVYDCVLGKVVPWQERTPKDTIQIITDEVEPVRNIVTREMVTSKSRLRRFYKEQGYEEIGNEVPRESARLADHLMELKDRGEW